MKDDQLQKKKSVSRSKEHNTNLEKLIKGIDIEAIKEKAAIATLHGVDPCKAPQNCQALQYHCSAQWCKYDGSLVDQRVLGAIQRSPSAREWLANHRFAPRKPQE